MAIPKRYEIINEKHGEGGFGKVSKLKDLELDRLVAVKQLELGLFNDPNLQERFRREAKALAKMSHPNIPAIYDVNFDNAEMLIYFEFIEGTTMRDIVTSGDVPSMDNVRRWFRQVASALEHAHGKNIIHRDIKPDNIVISSDDMNATLVDFGIALTADDVANLTKTGLVIGTPGYMSPEQQSGEELDARTDIYSLGITLYEIMAGHLPHAGVYVSLSDANESIHPAIDELVKGAIQQDKNQRIQSTEDFITNLRSTFRTDIPLSELLTDARLHEVVDALRQLSAVDFHEKPLGQRLLLMTRLKDLIRTDLPNMKAATAQVIALFTNLAQNEDKDRYRPIIDASLEWGYEKSFGPTWIGHQDIRNSLLDVAKVVSNEGHSVISESLFSFFEVREIDKLPGWYCHDIRKLVLNLLANPKCKDDSASGLDDIYNEVNIASH